MTEEARKLFPSPDMEPGERERQLDLLLSRVLAGSRVPFAEKGATVRSQPRLLGDQISVQSSAHRRRLPWLVRQRKQMIVEAMHKKPRPITIYTEPMKRADGKAYMATAYLSARVIERSGRVGRNLLRSAYLKDTLFPE